MSQKELTTKEKMDIADKIKAEIMKPAKKAFKEAKEIATTAWCASFAGLTVEEYERGDRK